MKFFVAIAFAVLSVVSARPAEQLVTVQQDTLGNYRVTYTIGNIVKTEERTADGSVRGTYSYIDDLGRRQTINYRAGLEGVVAEGDIPVAPVNVLVPVQDTPEVAHARIEHLNLFNQELLARSSVPLYIPPTPQELEQQRLNHLAGIAKARTLFNPAVPDTPEITEAKREHLAAHEERL